MRCSSHEQTWLRTHFKLKWVPPYFPLKKICRYLTYKPNDEMNSNLTSKLPFRRESYGLGVKLTRPGVKIGRAEALKFA